MKRHLMIDVILIIVGIGSLLILFVRVTERAHAKKKTEAAEVQTWTNAVVSAAIAYGYAAHEKDIPLEIASAEWKQETPKR